MKCPVCGQEDQTMLCPKCGFDSSRDYGKYPTFGTVGRVQSASALKRERERKERPVEPVRIYWEPKPVPKPEPPAAPEPKTPEPELTRRDEPKKRVQKESEEEPWYLAPWVVLAKYTALVLMVIGMIVTAVDLVKPKQAENEGQEPGGTVQMQQPPETTLPKVIAPQLTNVLRNNNGTFTYHPSVFGSEYQRGQIKSVTFLDTLVDMPNDAWDVSEAKNGRVMAWVKSDGDLYDLYIGAEGGVWANHDGSNLFAGYINASEITFGDAFHTENMQDMESMFEECGSLTSLDLSSFDTAHVQAMKNMFRECGSLTSLDLSSFNTANVQDMDFMFFKCGGLTNLDLSNFNTANVQSMDRMFMGCDSLTSLDLSSFDTACVQNMDWMFYGCVSLNSLDLSNFDTTNVQDMERMFYECSSLASLDLSSFDTANVQSLSYIFYKCGNLTDLKLGERFVTTNAYTSFMFDGCPAGADYQHLVH